MQQCCAHIRIIISRREHKNAFVFYLFSATQNRFRSPTDDVTSRQPNVNVGSKRLEGRPSASSAATPWAAETASVSVCSCNSRWSCSTPTSNPPLGQKVIASTTAVASSQPRLSSASENSRRFRLRRAGEGRTTHSGRMIALKTGLWQLENYFRTDECCLLPALHICSSNNVRCDWLMKRRCV